MIKQLITRIKLLPNKKKEFYFAFYKILGFFPSDIKLYEEALLHKSYSKEAETGRYSNNERLEFLGDAILSAIITDLIFHKFETKKEGFLTNTRSKIVQRETLNQIASELGLNKMLVSSPRVNTQKNNVLGNALEALIGAVYLDKGYGPTKKFIEERIINPYINIDIIAKKEVNFKSKLIEWSQKNRVNLDFCLTENFTDDENNPVFQTQSTLNGIICGVGVGYSKKESQQNAAKMALKKLKSDKDFITRVIALNEKKEVENLDEKAENPSPDALQHLNPDTTEPEVTGPETEERN